MTARALSPGVFIAFWGTTFLVHTPAGTTAGTSDGCGATSDFPDHSPLHKTASPPNAAQRTPWRTLALNRFLGNRMVGRLLLAALRDVNRAAAASATPITSTLRNGFRGATASFSRPSCGSAADVAGSAGRSPHNKERAGSSTCFSTRQRGHFARCCVSSAALADTGSVSASKASSQFIGDLPVSEQPLGQFAEPATHP